MLLCPTQYCSSTRRVLQSTAPASATLYYRVLLQYYCVLQSATRSSSVSTPALARAGVPVPRRSEAFEKRLLMCKTQQLIVPEPDAQQSIAAPPGRAQNRDRDFPPTEKEPKCKVAQQKKPSRPQKAKKKFRKFGPHLPGGSWCSGITPAQHAGGPGLNPHSCCRPLWGLALFCFCLLKGNKILDFGAGADTTTPAVLWTLSLIFSHTFWFLVLWSWGPYTGAQVGVSPELRQYQLTTVLQSATPILHCTTK